MNATVLVAAVALIVAGVWAIYWPAALIVAGVFLLPTVVAVRPVRGDE